MKTIFKYTLGGFFRTFGKILCYLIIGILLSLILSQINFKKIKLPNIFAVLDVYAANYQMGDVISNATFSINNTTITTNNKAWIGANSNTNFHLQSDALWSPEQNDIDYQYGYISFCASSDFNATNFVPGNYSKNARLFNSYQKCQVANSNYNDAYVYYITWQINNLNACNTGVSTTYCQLDNNFDFRVNKAMEYSLIDFGLSDKQIVVDTSSGMIIQQNQTIINNIQQQQQQQQQNHQETINTITDDNTNQSINEASNFFSNFNTNTHGLTGIITAPLSAIQSLSSSTCTPLTLPLPFVNRNLTLPCMRQIYDDNFGAFMQIYDVITLGIVAYWICVRIFSLVKDFKNPEHDEVEVVDL